jgi:site-specific recombinase XerD
LSEKRKDKKGRIFRSGEGQRPNKTYFYRYHRSGDKKWSYVYAPTLEELRQKEEVIQRDLLDGIDYAGGEITVAELVDRYINLRRGLKENSMRAYGSAINRIHTDPFGSRMIRSVRLSDGKGWFVSLHDKGLKQNTIGILQSVLRPAFEMAVDDDMIRKNPFKFKLSDVIPNDAYVRSALTKAQQERYLQFIRDHGKDNYYDDIVILLGTGLRASELYGLTKADIDFDRRCIHVRRQLCRTAEKPYFVTPPKTKSGIRNVPMTDAVYMALMRVVKARTAPKVELPVDGHSGFLFLDKSGMPKVAMHLENYMRGLQARFEKAYGKPVPRITPHVLRHTFCTNVQQAGLDVKSLQYLMGHSNASVTLDVYTHSSFDSVERAFEQIASSL